MDEESIRDLFAGLGPVTIRRMFGGKSIYFDGEIIAIDLFDAVMVKGDAKVVPIYEAAGAERWVYEGKRGPVPMPYWSVPVDVIEDTDEMTRWARLAFDVALRSKAAKAAKPLKAKKRRKTA